MLKRRRMYQRLYSGPAGAADGPSVFGRRLVDKYVLPSESQRHAALTGTVRHPFTPRVSAKLCDRLSSFPQMTRVGIYTSFGPSIPVYTCIYTDTRIYGLNTYDD